MTKIVLLESTARGVVPQGSHELIDGDIYFNRSKALAEIYIQDTHKKEVKLLTLQDAVIDFVSAGSLRIIGYHIHEAGKPDRQVWQLHYNNVFSQQPQAAAKGSKGDEMNEAKHTPGPWTQGHSAQGRSCVWLAGHTEPSGNMGESRFWINCNTEANARLIAAAPENLQSNYELAMIVRELCAAYGHPLPEAAIARSDAAIAKATGGSA